jgi:hypothetical protein
MNPPPPEIKINFNLNRMNPPPPQIKINFQLESHESAAAGN